MRLLNISMEYSQVLSFGRLDASSFRHVEVIADHWSCPWYFRPTVHTVRLVGQPARLTGRVQDSLVFEIQLIACLLQARELRTISFLYLQNGASHGDTVVIWV